MTYDEYDEEQPTWDADAMKFEVKISNVQEDAFVRNISQGLAERVSKEMLQRIEDTANALIEQRLTAKLQEVVTDIIDKGLSRELQPSDEFSTPKGEPITPLEFIAKGAEKFLEQHLDDNGNIVTPNTFSRRTSRRIDIYMRGVITAQFEKELGAEVAAMKTQIRDQMKAAASEWLAKFQAETVAGVEKAKALASRI